MPKRIITKEVNSFRPYEIDGPIEKTIAFLQSIKDGFVLGPGESLQLDYDECYYESRWDNSPSPTIRVMHQRPETDEECVAREYEEKVAKAEQANRERAEYERLAAKFGK